MGDELLHDWSPEEINNPSVRLLRISSEFDINNEEGKEHLSKFNSALIDIAYDVETVDETKYKEVLDIFNNIDIISILERHQRECIVDDGEFVPMKILRWIFFKCIRHTEERTTLNEYVKREDPDAIYYNLVSVLTDIYDQVTTNILNGNGVHSKKRLNKIFFRPESYVIVREWLDKSRPNVKFSLKR